MTYTGFVGIIFRILPLNGSVFFLAAGDSRIIYKYDKTQAGVQGQSSALSETIYDMIKSWDTAGYLIATDLSPAVKIMDITAGFSIVGTINHPLGHNTKFIAQSSINAEEYAVVDDSGGDDVDRVVIQGTTVTHF